VARALQRAESQNRQALQNEAFSSSACPPDMTSLLVGKHTPAWDNLAMEALRKRTALRADWDIHVRSLDTQDLASVRGAVEDRLRAVDQLSADGWRLAEKPLPDYRRGESPIRILPIRDGAAAPS